VSAAPKPKRPPLVVVYTGHGKGKTTAALGILCRAWGRGMKVAMLSFIKTKTSNYGEEQAGKRLGIEVIPLGGGYTWLSQDIEKDKALARELWTMAQEKMSSGQYDIIILDEFTYPLKYGWLPMEEVLGVLRRRPESLHVVITGRDAPQELIDFADLVTEMREVKHPLRQGIKAQPGLDF
jgi:cob(I)alamin adenosyltransferase